MVSRKLILSIFVWTLFTTLTTASCVSKTYILKAVELGYGYFDNSHEFHWYEWDPKDPNIV